MYNSQGLLGIAKNTVERAIRTSEAQALLYLEKEIFHLGIQI